MHLQNDEELKVLRSSSANALDALCKSSEPENYTSYHANEEIT